MGTNRKPRETPYLTHPPAVIPIDVGRQLFVDDFLIEQTTLRRKFHYPERYEGNPILKPETPAELNNGQRPLAAMISDGVWYDPHEQVFDMWYQAGWRTAPCWRSKDGLHWERPALDIVPGTNRILPERSRHVRHGTGICLDLYTHDPQQRFKMLIYENDKRRANVYISPDGMHWTYHGFATNCGDNTTMFYNPFRQKWVYSIREWYYGRARDYREHADFLKGMKWTKAEVVPWAGTDELDLPDPAIVALMPGEDEIRKAAQKEGRPYAEVLRQYRAKYGDPTQLYIVDAVAYESLMLGVFSIHRGPENRVCEKLKRAKLCDLEFAYSRDGFHWQRPDRTPFLASTRKEGDWERAYLHIATGVCNIVGDRLFFYYSGWSGKSPAKGSDMYAGGSTGVAFLRRDGFASMDAAEKAGTLTTRLLTFRGKHLFVNLNAPHGESRRGVGRARPADRAFHRGKLPCGCGRQGPAGDHLDGRADLARWPGEGTAAFPSSRRRVLCVLDYPRRRRRQLRLRGRWRPQLHRPHGHAVKRRVKRVGSAL